MSSLTLHLGAQRLSSKSPADFAEFVRHAVHALITVNTWAFKNDLSLRDIRTSGEVVYRREAPGYESFEDVYAITRQGYGDCEDLAAARVGYLRAREHDRATANITWQPKNPEGTAYLYHVTVRRASGVIEDTSRELGMGNEPGEWRREGALLVYTLFPGRSGVVPAPRPVREVMSK